MMEAFERFVEELDFDDISGIDPEVEDEELLERRDQYQRARQLLHDGNVESLSNCAAFMVRIWEDSAIRTLRDLQNFHPVDGYNQDGAFYLLAAHSFYTVLLTGISQSRHKWDVETAELTAATLTTHYAQTLDDEWMEQLCIAFPQSQLRKAIVEANYLYVQLQPVEA
jgi:hypothetical protein